MPSAVYTLPLWEVVNAGTTFPIFGPSVPAGFAWVVRDVAFYFPDSSASLSNPGQVSLLVDGVQIAATPAFTTLANVLYGTRDLRQSMLAGATFELQAFASGWNVRVTGYQLTAT